MLFDLLEAVEACLMPCHFDSWRLEFGLHDSRNMLICLRAWKGGMSYSCDRALSCFASKHSREDLVRYLVMDAAKEIVKHAGTTSSIGPPTAQ